MDRHKLEDKLISCLDKYSDTHTDLGTNLQKAFDNAAYSEKIVPVLGTQGMGKSTLINGLLEENILPNDVDETTCVPVEVKYGDNERALVHFADSSKTVTVNTIDELKEFVDNNYNPANEKGVSRIELFRSKDLLRNGLVIVDLPGVGSLTKANEETTKRYVENLCSAIFVIPTVPTIRSKEAMFIKSLWQQFGTAIFVQNDWGETRQEIDESVDFNTKVLKSIANELQIPFDGNILIVNAYNAIEGALKKDRKEVKDSNIEVLHNKIVDLASHWDEDRTRELTARLLFSIAAAERFVNRRIEDIDKSKEEKEKNNKQRLKDFDRTTEDISDKADEIIIELDEKCEEIKQIAQTQARSVCSKMRGEMHHVIDGGVYDGEHLTQAFNDYSNDTSKDYFEAVSEEIYKLKEFLNTNLNEIANICLEEEIGTDYHIGGASLSSENKFKYEKGLQVGMNIGGAVAGAVGAAPLLGLLVAQPAGIAIAAVGLAIYGIFSLGGYFIKKGVGISRAREAKNLVDPKIKDIEKQLVSKTAENIDSIRQEIKSMLDKVIRMRESERKQLLRSFEADTDNDDKEQLESDLQYLKTQQEVVANGK